MVDILPEYREFLLAVAKKAAKSTRGSVYEMARRPKSQSFLVGKLRSQFNLDVDTARPIVEKICWEWREDPDMQEVFERVARPNSKGHEAVESSKWDPRIQKVVQVVGGRLWGSHELFEAVARELRWSQTFFTSVMAAADARGVLSYSGKSSAWGPSELIERAREQLRVLERWKAPHRDLKGPIVTSVEFRGGKWVPYRIYTEDQMNEVRRREGLPPLEREGIDPTSDHSDAMAKSEASITPDERLTRIAKAHRRKSALQKRYDRKLEAAERRHKLLIEEELAKDAKFLEMASNTLDAELDALASGEQPDDDED